MNDSAYESRLQHGRILRGNGRLEDAERFFREALAGQPDDFVPYYELALCQLSMEERKKEALQSIDAAIRLGPEEAGLLSLKALILSRLDRHKEALSFAQDAIALEPDNHFHFTAKAQAYGGMMKWAEAETSARQALTLDADDLHARNLLAMFLRMQNKREESEIAVQGLLSDGPEDEFAHLNAGWSALQRGDRKSAEHHFSESLRLDPEFDAAREGLLESFKARSFFYRLYLKYTFFMQRFTGGQQFAVIIGLYVLFRVLRSSLEDTYPILAGVVLVLWLAFALWSVLAPGIGGFLIFCDRQARLILKKNEVWEALGVGGVLLLGFLALSAGFGLGLLGLALIAGMFMISVVPAAYVFTNESKSGRNLFGAALLIVYACGIMGALSQMLDGWQEPSDLSLILSVPVVLVGVACTWLGNVSALRS